jgi:DNA repair protein RecO (recombination protein O)
VSLYRDEGVVLRTHKLGEADRIITLLTRDNGKVRAVARGVRRTRSRFGARLEPFMHVDLQLARGRNLDVVSQATTVTAYAGPIVASYPRFTAATAMVEMADRLVVEEHDVALQQYLLLLGGLRALARQEHDLGLVLDAYLLRSVAVAGFAPSFDECARCDEPGPHRWFSVTGGGSVCAGCRPPGSSAVAPEVVELMSALLTGDWEVAESAESTYRSRAAGFVAAFSQWHLERRLRSLPHVERV